MGRDYQFEPSASGLSRPESPELRAPSAVPWIPVIEGDAPIPCSMIELLLVEFMEKLCVFKHKHALYRMDTSDEPPLLWRYFRSSNEWDRIALDSEAGVAPYRFLQNNPAYGDA